MRKLNIALAAMALGALGIIATLSMAAELVAALLVAPVIDHDGNF
jgi:hypothetical protein